MNYHIKYLKTLGALSKKKMAQSPRNRPEIIKLI